MPFVPSTSHGKRKKRMRYVPRLDPILVKGISFTQKMFIDHLLEEKRFTTSGAGLRMSVRIERAFSDITGDVVAVEQADWAVLTAVAEEPAHGYPNLVQTNPDGSIVRSIVIARELLPFVEAIVQAKETKPSVEASAS